MCLCCRRQPCPSLTLDSVSSVRRLWSRHLCQQHLVGAALPSQRNPRLWLHWHRTCGRHHQSAGLHCQGHLLSLQTLSMGCQACALLCQRLQLAVQCLPGSRLGWTTTARLLQSLPGCHLWRTMSVCNSQRLALAHAQAASRLHCRGVRCVCAYPEGQGL